MSSDMYYTHYNIFILQRYLDLNTVSMGASQSAPQIAFCPTDDLDSRIDAYISNFASTGSGDRADPAQPQRQAPDQLGEDTSNPDADSDALSARPSIDHHMEHLVAGMLWRVTADRGSGGKLGGHEDGTESKAKDAGENANEKNVRLDDLLTRVVQSATAAGSATLNTSHTPAMEHINSSISRRCHEATVSGSTASASCALQEKVLNYICERSVSRARSEHRKNLLSRISGTVLADSDLHFVHQEKQMRLLPQLLRPTIHSVLEAEKQLSTSKTVSDSERAITYFMQNVNQLPPLSLHNVTVCSEASNMDHLARALIERCSTAFHNISDATGEESNHSPAPSHIYDNFTAMLVSAVKLAISRGSQTTLLGSIAGLIEADLKSKSAPKVSEESTQPNDVASRKASAEAIEALENVYAERIMSSFHSSRGGAPAVIGPPEIDLHSFKGTWYHALAMHSQPSPCDIDILRVTYKLSEKPASANWSLEVYENKMTPPGKEGSARNNDGEETTPRLEFRLVRSLPFEASVSFVNEVLSVVLPKALRVYRGEYLALRCLPGKSDHPNTEAHLCIAMCHDLDKSWPGEPKSTKILHEISPSEVERKEEDATTNASNASTKQSPDTYSCMVFAYSQEFVLHNTTSGSSNTNATESGNKCKACPGWSAEGRTLPTSPLLRKQWRVVNSSGVNVYSSPSKEGEAEPLFSKYMGDVVTEYNRKEDWIQIHPGSQNDYALQEEKNSGGTYQNGSSHQQWMQLYPASGGHNLIRHDNVPPTGISQSYIVPNGGHRVVRGPSWLYGDQDCDKLTGVPGKGTVMRVWPSEHIAQVLWDNGNKQTYWISPVKRDIIIAPLGQEAFGSSLRENIDVKERKKAAIGCGPDCGLSHSRHGPCLLCGNNWGNHSGHTCSGTTNRGSWVVHCPECGKDWRNHNGSSCGQTPEAVARNSSPGNLAFNTTIDSEFADHCVSQRILRYVRLLCFGVPIERVKYFMKSNSITEREQQLALDIYRSSQGTNILPPSNSVNCSGQATEVNKSLAASGFQNRWDPRYEPMPALPGDHTLFRSTMAAVTKALRTPDPGRTATALLGLLQQLSSESLLRHNINSEGKASNRKQHKSEVAESKGEENRQANATFPSHGNMSVEHDASLWPTLRTITGGFVYEDSNSSREESGDPNRQRVLHAHPNYDESGYPYSLGPEILADRDSWGAPGYIFETPVPRDGTVRSISLRLNSSNGETSLEVHVYAKVSSKGSSQVRRRRGRQGAALFRLLCTANVRIDGEKVGHEQTVAIEGGVLNVRRGQYIGLFCRNGNINLSSCAKRSDIRSSVFHYPSSSSFRVGQVMKFNTYGHVDASSGRILVPGYRVVIGNPFNNFNCRVERGPIYNAFACKPTLDSFRALKSLLFTCLRPACLAAQKSHSAKHDGLKDFDQQSSFESSHHEEYYRAVCVLRLLRSNLREYGMNGERISKVTIRIPNSLFDKETPHKFLNKIEMMSESKAFIHSKKILGVAEPTEHEESKNNANDKGDPSREFIDVTLEGTEHSIGVACRLLRDHAQGGDMIVDLHKEESPRPKSLFKQIFKHILTILYEGLKIADVMTTHPNRGTIHGGLPPSGPQLLEDILSLEIAETISLIPLPDAAVECFDTLCRTEGVPGPASARILIRLINRFTSLEGLLPVLHSQGSIQVLMKCLLWKAQQKKGSNREVVITAPMAQSAVSFIFTTLRGLALHSSIESIEQNKQAKISHSSPKLEISKEDVFSVYSLILEVCISTDCNPPRNLADFTGEISRVMFLPLLVTMRTESLPASVFMENSAVLNYLQALDKFLSRHDRTTQHLVSNATVEWLEDIAKKIVLLLSEHYATKLTQMEQLPLQIETKLASPLLSGGLCESRMDIPDENLMGGDNGEGLGAPTESEFLSYAKSKGRVLSLKRGNGILNKNWSKGWGLRLMRTTLTALVNLGVDPMEALSLCWNVCRHVNTLAATYINRKDRIDLLKECVSRAAILARLHPPKIHPNNIAEQCFSFIGSMDMDSSEIMEAMRSRRAQAAVRSEAVGKIEALTNSFLHPPLNMVVANTLWKMISEVTQSGDPLQCLSACGLNNEILVKTKVAKLVAKCFPPYKQPDIMEPLLAFAIKFSDHENLLCLLHEELSQAFDDTEQHDISRKQAFVLDCFQMLALKLARSHVLSTRGAEDKCSHSAAFALQLFKSTVMLFNRTDPAVHICVFGILLDQVVLRVLGPHFSTNEADNVLSCVFKLATKKNNSTMAKSGSSVMVLALGLLRHLVQERLIHIDAHGEHARSILRLVSYKSTASVSAEASDLFRCILNQKDVDLKVFAKQFSDALAMIKEKKPCNNLDMLVALLSVLSPCDCANRVGANVAIIATERASDIQPLHLPPGGVRYDTPTTSRFNSKGTSMMGMSSSAQEKQPSLLRQVSITPVEDEEEIRDYHTRATKSEDKRDPHTFAGLNKYILSNWHDVGTVISINNNEIEVEKQEASLDKLTPRCSNGHMMVMSEYSQDGYESGYICDKCRGRSSSGHNGGTLERWFCQICHSDYCFMCVPKVKLKHDSSKYEEKPCRVLTVLMEHGEKWQVPEGRCVAMPAVALNHDVLATILGASKDSHDESLSFTLLEIIEAGIFPLQVSTHRYNQRESLKLLQAGFLRLSHQILREFQALGKNKTSTLTTATNAANCFYMLVKTSIDADSILRKLARISNLFCINSRRTLQESIDSMYAYQISNVKKVSKKKKKIDTRKKDWRKQLEKQNVVKGGRIMSSTEIGGEAKTDAAVLRHSFTLNLSAKLELLKQRETTIPQDNRTYLDDRQSTAILRTPSAPGVDFNTSFGKLSFENLCTNIHILEARSLLCNILFMWPTASELRIEGVKVAGDESPNDEVSNSFEECNPIEAIGGFEALHKLLYLKLCGPLNPFRLGVGEVSGTELVRSLATNSGLYGSAVRTCLSSLAVTELLKCLDDESLDDYSIQKLADSATQSGSQSEVDFLHSNVEHILRVNFEPTRWDRPRSASCEGGCLFDYYPDKGRRFNSSRGGLFGFGWNEDNSTYGRDRSNSSKSHRRRGIAPPSSHNAMQNTITHILPNLFWKCRVPEHGLYRVHLSLGDPSFNSRLDIRINEVQLLDGESMAAGKMKNVSFLVPVHACARKLKIFNGIELGAYEFILSCNAPSSHKKDATRISSIVVEGPIKFAPDPLDEEAVFRIPCLDLASRIFRVLAESPKSLVDIFFPPAGNIDALNALLQYIRLASDVEVCFDLIRLLTSALAATPESIDRNVEFIKSFDFLESIVAKLQSRDSSLLDRVGTVSNILQSLLELLATVQDRWCRHLFNPAQAPSVLGWDSWSSEDEIAPDIYNSKLEEPAQSLVHLLKDNPDGPRMDLLTLLEQFKKNHDSQNPKERLPLNTEVKSCKDLLHYCKVLSHVFVVSKSVSSKVSDMVVELKRESGTSLSSLPPWAVKWLPDNGEMRTMRPRVNHSISRNGASKEGKESDSEEEDGVAEKHPPARQEKANAIHAMLGSAMGWDMRLICVALKECQDNPDVAVEWLMGEMGSSARSQMAQVAQKAKGDKVSFEVDQAELPICKAFRIKFTYKEGKKPDTFKPGPWVAMYRLRANNDGSILRPDDLEIYQRICYHDLTQTDFDRGFINWPCPLAPDTPGMFEFRYFASRSCKRKWGTSAPIPFKVDLVDVATLTDAAMFLTALQPLADDLAGLSAVAHAEALSQNVLARQLDKRQLLCCKAEEGKDDSAWKAMLDIYSRASGKKFVSFSKEDFLRRFDIVQAMNACVVDILPAVDLTVAGEEWSIANLICNLRSGLYPETKRRILRTALRDTDSALQAKSEATFNLPRAMAAKKMWMATMKISSRQSSSTHTLHRSGRFDPNISLSSNNYHHFNARNSFEGMTIFEQAFEQLGSLPDSHLRIFGEVVFKCKMLGLSVEGTGPYRQILTDICEELQLPGLVSGSPLIKNPNRRLDAHAPNRDTVLTNPSAGSRRSLAMLEFLGKLIGVAIRNSSSNTVLPLQFTNVFWKQISRERMTRKDLRGVDCYLYDRLKEIVNAKDEDEFRTILTNLGDDNLLCLNGFFTAYLSCGREIELVPGGKSVPLTFQNRKIFANLLMRCRLSESRVQMAAVRRGLARIVPMAQLLRLFTWKELEIMVCGEKTVNLRLLKDQTKYSGVFLDNVGHPVIQWFWEILEGYDNEGRADFLKVSLMSYSMYLLFVFTSTL